MTALAPSPSAMSPCRANFGIAGGCAAGAFAAGTQPSIPVGLHGLMAVQPSFPPWFWRSPGAAFAIPGPALSSAQVHGLFLVVLLLLLVLVPRWRRRGNNGQNEHDRQL